MDLARMCYMQKAGTAGYMCFILLFIHFEAYGHRARVTRMTRRPWLGFRGPGLARAQEFLSCRMRREMGWHSINGHGMGRLELVVFASKEHQAHE
jgi:hypothetical protein